MIFVILGTQKFQMDRLLKLVDELVATEKISDCVFAQTGLTDYHPVNYPFERFLDREDFDRLISEADTIITHGGVSSVITAMKLGKPVIICPRLAKYGENGDNHQQEIARAFARKGFVLCYEEGNDLGSLIETCRSTKFTKYVSQTNNIVRIIKQFLA